MQCVRPVAGARLEPDRGQLGAELWLAVDADMPADALRGVIVIVQPPADLFGQRCGNGRRQTSTWPQDPEELGHHGKVVGDVLEDLRGDDSVEGAVGERQRQAIGLHHRSGQARPGQLAGFVHRRERVSGLDHLGEREVGGNN